ncbi:MFS transporter [Paracoccaceae bacterium]|nr:MFS transporter [Paracoccaceae bacterium]|tara:strand:+ start:5147 stop:6367 length:1221 start_codon:yes stop_codon:yes gene_type:complete
MNDEFSISNVSTLSKWRRPEALLILMAIALPLAFSVWSALLNNFVVEIIRFDGLDIGLLHTIREIPGFLAVGVISILLFFREQTLALLMLCVLGLATAVTAWFPFLSGILTITLLSSIGFHFFETVNQSLQLQWFSKKEAPRKLGKLMAIGSAATLIAYTFLVLGWDKLNLSFNSAYMIAGFSCFSLAVLGYLIFPNFEAPIPQRKRMVLRKRYWLYYLLQFMSGARRQIFVVFAGFMMVERFGLDVQQLTTIYLINLMFNIALAPLLGRAVARYGERKALAIEYFGLSLVFFAYGGIYLFGWGVFIATLLYLLDHLFFALALAIKTYFQKIADPQDIAATAAVAFTINHIAAIFLPLGLGFLWLASPFLVFCTAGTLSFISFALALLIPRQPVKGNETIFCAPKY